MFEALVSLYAPLHCLGCQVEGGLLCTECSLGLSPVAERCYRCHTLSVGGRTCVACRRQSKLYSVTVVGIYDGVAKDLVRHLKFNGGRAAAEVMARQMAPLIEAEQFDAILALPTATGRVRQRGFDQADLLARALAHRLDLPRLVLLARTGQSRQVGASRQQRLKQLASAYTVKRPAAVSGQRILLVDDVLTTGASLESAAAVLKASGAKRVCGAVFARA